MCLIKPDLTGATGFTSVLFWCTGKASVTLQFNFDAPLSDHNSSALRLAMTAKKSAKGYGCALLFVAPFGLVGIGMVGLSLYMALNWALIQNWVATPATIQAIQLKTSHDEDGNTYRVVANYRYTWLGQDFVSDRVSLHNGSDNIGSFHKRTYRRLQPLVQVPQGSTCYVNPSNPAEAILVRDARWEMFAFYSIFATIFGSIGVLGGMAMWSFRQTAVVADSRMELYPDEPWNWQPRWQNGQVQSLQHDQLRAWNRAAVWWVIATTPTAVFSMLALVDGQWWAVLGFITPTAAAMIVRTARRHRSNLREFGDAYLQLTEFPLRPGMETTLAAVFKNGGLPRTVVESHVECQCQQSDGDSGNRKTTVWEHRQQIEPQQCRIIADGLCIAVPLPIPDSAKPTTSADESVVWKLTLKLPTSKKPMKVAFVLPVFEIQRSAESSLVASLP